MKRFDNREQCYEYVRSLSIAGIMDLCVELLMQQSTDKVFLTPEQFSQFFKVKGLRLVPETRGRNSKNVTDCLELNVSD